LVKKKEREKIPSGEEKNGPSPLVQSRCPLTEPTTS